ncbi:MAG: P-loop NTPase fold protein, partial [Candidatus Hodarchaeota archaeon]
TSMLNLIENEIIRRNAEYVIVRFNPWNFSNLNQLIMMFFKELKSALNKDKRSKIVKAIGKLLEILSVLLTLYGSLTRDIFSKEIAKFLKNYGSEIKDFPQNSNILNIKKKINKLLDEYKKRIIIFIDDIDRLDSESICLLFRLIRLNADFNNTLFILTFDRKLVEKALDFEQNIPGREYLKKIIQVPFDLPVIEKSRIYLFLFEQLEKVLSEFKAINLDEYRWGNLFHSGFKTFFKNFRDVKRYINSIQLTFPQIYDEVNPVDFLGIECIRIFCPDVFLAVSKNKNLFLEAEGNYSEYIGDEQYKKNKEIIENIFKTSGEIFLPAIRNICIELFPQLRAKHHHSYNKIWTRDKRICSQKFFDKYFLLHIPLGAISESEISDALENCGNKDYFIKLLKSLNIRRLMKEFILRMYDYLEDIDILNVPTIIEAFLEIGDDFPTEKIGAFNFGTDLEIVFFIRELLMKFEDIQERGNLLKFKIDNCPSFNLPIRILSIIEQNENGRYISDACFEEIKNLVIQRINQAANNGVLQDMPNFAYNL